MSTGTGGPTGPGQEAMPVGTEDAELKRAAAEARGAQAHLQDSLGREINTGENETIAAAIDAAEPPVTERENPLQAFEEVAANAESPSVSEPAAPAEGASTLPQAEPEASTTREPEVPAEMPPSAAGEQSTTQPAGSIAPEEQHAEPAASESGESTQPEGAPQPSGQGAETEGQQGAPAAEHAEPRQVNIPQDGAIEIGGQLISPTARRIEETSDVPAWERGYAEGMRQASISGDPGRVQIIAQDAVQRGIFSSEQARQELGNLGVAVPAELQAAPEGQAHPTQTPAVPAPPLPETTAGNAIQERIHNVGDPAHPDPERQARAQEYDAAVKQRNDLAAQDKKDSPEYQTAQKTVERIEQDAGFEVRQQEVDAIADPKEREQAQEALRNEEVAIWTQRTLDDDPAYQAGVAQLESGGEKRWTELDGKPQSEQDTAIEGMNRGERNAYQQHIELRESVQRIADDAEFAARERYIQTRPESERPALLQQLESDRRQAYRDSILRRDSEYQALQRRHRQTEQRLLQHHLTPEQMRGLGDMTWEQVMADRTLGPIVGQVFTKKEYDRYQYDRRVMNGREGAAEETVNDTRMEANIKPDGMPFTGTPEQIAAQKAELMRASAKEDRSRGPGAVRKVFRGLNEFIDRIVGKAGMEEHGKAMRNLGRRLISEYGVFRGLLFPKDEQAKLLRAQMGKELFAYLRVSFARKFLGFLLLSAAVWLIYPIIIGKALEMTKPFGGQ